MSNPERIWVDDPRDGYSSIYIEEAAPNSGAVPYFSAEAVEKAVREEREAMVRFACAFNWRQHGATGFRLAITFGEHRK
jgi:hypothetical protein